jgi:hypothetical protein
MYNQFNLCKLCDDEPEVYNGLCRTCLDTSSETEDIFIGGTHTEKFTHRRLKHRKKVDNRLDEIESD